MDYDYIAIGLLVASVTAVLSESFETDLVLQHILWAVAMGASCWLIDGSATGMIVAVIGFALSSAWWFAVKFMEQSKKREKIKNRHRSF